MSSPQITEDGFVMLYYEKVYPDFILNFKTWTWGLFSNKTIWKVQMQCAKIKTPALLNIHILQSILQNYKLSQKQQLHFLNWKCSFSEEEGNGMFDWPLSLCSNSVTCTKVEHFILLKWVFNIDHIVYYVFLGFNLQYYLLFRQKTFGVFLLVHCY